LAAGVLAAAFLAAAFFAAVFLAGALLAAFVTGASVAGVLEPEEVCAARRGSTLLAAAAAVPAIKFLVLRAIGNRASSRPWRKRSTRGRERP
jgi:hypothetical protein